MLSQGVCRVVLGPWNIESSGLMSESRYRECVVSYLAVAAGAGTGNRVRARPLAPGGGSVALVRELLDVLRIQLACLDRKMAIRGAVLVDFAHIGVNGDDPVSGPTLARAREMQANEVVFPRIAVEEAIVRRLRSDESLWTDGHGLRAEMDVIDCMLRVDEAGLHYVDYLRAGLGDFDYDFDRYAQFLERHKRIVETGLAGTPVCADSGTYHWLKTYHNARIDEDISRSDADAFVGACGRGMADALAPLRVA